MLTRPHNGHAACHYCGACGKGCDVGAFFNSSDYLIEPAFETGRLQVIDNAVVARVLVDDEGRANGVQYFDRYTKEEHRVKARVVIVAASCIDSTRILLNSKSHAVSERHRQLVRRDRPLPERTGSVAHVRLRAGTDGRHRCRTTTASAASTSTCRASIIATAASAITCAASACSSGAAARKRLRRWAKTLPGFGADFKKAV